MFLNNIPDSSPIKKKKEKSKDKKQYSLKLLKNIKDDSLPFVYSTT
jgi:hypothetical protein